MQFAQYAEPMRWVKSAIGNVVAAPKFDCWSVMLYSNIPYRETSQNHCIQTAGTYRELGQLKLTLWNESISNVDSETIRARYSR